MVIARPAIFLSQVLCAIRQLFTQITISSVIPLQKGICPFQQHVEITSFLQNCLCYKTTIKQSLPGTKQSFLLFQKSQVMKFHFNEKIPDNFFRCSPKISGMTIIAGFCGGDKHLVLAYLGIFFFTGLRLTVQQKGEGL